MSATPYHEFPGLADFYLEDSFVIGVHMTGEALAFDLDVVLTESHPEYRPPKTGEHYCYRHGRLSFPGPNRIAVVEPEPMRPSTDANGQVDFGSIDALVLEEGRYRVTGSWGVIEIESAGPIMVLEPDDIGAR